MPEPQNSEQSPSIVPEPGQTVSLREVAAAAKVGLTTASLAVSGRPGVAPKTMEHVRAVAERMGYKPHPFVSSLMTQVSQRKRARTKVNLAWLHDGLSPEEDFRKPWGHYPTYTAALKRARELGYEGLEPCGCAEPDLSLRRLGGILKSRGIAGALVGGDSIKMRKLRELSEITLVKLGTPFLESLNHHVYADTYQGILLTCSRLWRAGYRRIGFVTGKWMSVMSFGNVDGAWHVFQNVIPPELRIPHLFDDITTAWVFDSVFADRTPTAAIRPPDFLEGEDWMGKFGEVYEAYAQGVMSETKVKEILHTFLLERWLEQYLPDAILCCDSRLPETLGRLGYRVPEDIGVAHLNLKADTRGWSGIDQQWEKMGTLAVDTLAHMLNMGQIGQTEHPVLRAVPGVWVEGETTRRHDPPIYPRDRYVDHWIKEYGRVGVRIQQLPG